MVVLWISVLYSRTVLLLAFKILTLVLNDSFVGSRMFFGCRNPSLGFLIRVFISASGSPRLSVMLPRYLQAFNSSRVSQSGMICLMPSVLHLRIFTLWMLRPWIEEANCLLAVYTRICWSVCGRRSKSFSNTKLSIWIQSVHYILCCSWVALIFIIQSTAERTKTCISR